MAASQDDTFLGLGSSSQRVRTMDPSMFPDDDEIDRAIEYEAERERMEELAAAQWNEEVAWAEMVAAL